VRDFDGRPILGFVFEKKLPVMRERKEWASFAYAKACEFVAMQESGFIAEDLTLWYASHAEWPQAHSNGCWGAIWRKLINHDVVAKTREKRFSRAEADEMRGNKHRNMSIVWRRK
jgi:hypothetical protein